MNMQVENKIADHFIKKDRMAEKRKRPVEMKTVEKVKTPRRKKRKRLIIRNLSFKVDEEELKKIFSKFGNLTDVKIPLKEDGKKRGFAFIEFEDTKSLIQAMKLMNYKEICGRKVAIDFAVDKTTYQLNVQNLKREGKDVPMKRDTKSDPDLSKVKVEIKSEEESSESDGEDDEEEEEDEDEKRLNNFLKEFDSGADVLTKPQAEKNCEESSSDDESSMDESEDDNEPEYKSKKIKQELEETPKPLTKYPKKETHDVSEGKTVFFRNVSFMTTEESLKEAMEEYGKCEYSLLCVDQMTDHPKGTAFVKFTEKSSADKLMLQSAFDPGVTVDGRRLQCSLAISREEVAHMGDSSKKPKDKRNLNLLRVSTIMPKSQESEGVSHSDMMKRAELEIVKKRKLRNVNFFVSNQRLVIHNLPRKFTDVELRKLFKKAAGHGACITEARVMKEFKKLDSQGNAFTKGFGFVNFSNHEDALKALTELNNNPTIFTPQKRPIVEFSVENIVALQSKERRKEKIQMRNQRRTAEKRERQMNLISTDTEKGNRKDLTTQGMKSKAQSKNNKALSKNKKAQIKNSKAQNKKKKEDYNEKELPLGQPTPPKSKQKQKKGKPKQSRKEKKQVINKSQQDNLSHLISKYKGKLLNKIT